MKCKLCKVKEADQTGSHITSAFLLSSQIGKRGEEKAFLITTNPEQDYSKNQGDTGIKEDFIFCRDCEKRLGFIESIYATEITQKIEKKQFENNFYRTNLDNNFYILDCKRIHPIAFQLLIQSNIWRASVSEQTLYKDFSLSADLQERIRFNLDLFLPPLLKFKIAQTEKEWTKNVDECNELFDLIPFAIIKAENIENKEMTYEFFDNVSERPYHAILNEYFILLFDNSLSWEDDFFGFKNEVNLLEIINNSVDRSIICIVSNDRYFQTANKIKVLAVAQRHANIRAHVIAHLYRRGIYITPQIVNQMASQKIAEIKPEEYENQ